MYTSSCSVLLRLPIIGSCLFAIATSVSAQSNTWYVDAAAAPGGNGLTWATAFAKLDSALAAAAVSVGIDEVRVAHGAYVPTTQVDPLDKRSATFLLPAGTFVIGGWIAGQTGNAPLGIPTRTRLSGEIGIPGAADNVYHVVTQAVTPIPLVLNYTSGLSRMVVEHGNADGPAPTQKSGGGIICRRFASLQFSIELVDMTVRECEAELHGGGLYVEEAVAKVVRCTFSDNVVGERGGAIDVTGALGVFNSVFLRNEAAIGGAVSYGVAEVPIGTPFDIIANTRFFRNEASQFGGALAFDYAPAFSAGNPGLPIPGGDHYVTNCTFSENVAGAAGGAISADTGSFNLIRNTITWADAAPLDREITQGQTVFFAIVDGGYPTGFAIINADPLLGPAQVPAAASPARDAGNIFYLPTDIFDVDQNGNSTEVLPIDIRGAIRVQSVNVDIGAHEIG